MKLASLRQKLFSWLGNPKQQRASALLEELNKAKNPEALLNELGKDTGEIDVQKCVSLIQRGVDFSYPKEETISERNTVLAHSRPPRRTPSSPDAMVIAASKGLTEVVNALMQYTNIHPAQCSPASGLSALAAAAKYGHTDIFIRLDLALPNIDSDYNSYPGLALLPSYKMNAALDRIDDERTVYLWCNAERRESYDWAVKGAHGGIMSHLLRKDFDKIYGGMDYRDSDLAYQSAEADHKAEVAKKIADAKAALVKQDEAPAPTIPKL